MKTTLFFLAFMHCLAADTLVELKAGYFFFNNHKLNKIYTHGGEDVQLSASYPLTCFRGIHLKAYGSCEFAERTGYSLNAHEKTHFQAFPFSLGVKPVIDLTHYLQGYVTAGPRYVVTHVHNFSNYVDKHLTRGGIGGFANLGLIYTFCNGLTLDLFGEYSYVKVSYHTRKTNVMAHAIDVGGLTFGGGLGISF